MWSYYGSKNKIEIQGQKVKTTEAIYLVENEPIESNGILKGT